MSPPSSQIPPQDGRSSLFVRLYSEHRRKIRTIVTQSVPARDVDDVEQIVWLAVARALPDYDLSAPPSPWLYTIARRQCRDFRELRHHRDPLRADLDRRVRDVTDTAEAMVIRRTLLDALLRPLDPKERRMAEGVYGDDAPQEEIAAELGLTIHHMRRVFKSMRRKLDVGAQRFASARKAVVLAILDLCRSGRARARAHALRAVGVAGVAGPLLLMPRAASMADEQVFAAGPSTLASAAVVASSAPRSAPAPAEQSTATSRSAAPEAHVTPSEREEQSLERIQRLGAKNPVQALAAMAAHQRLFSPERFRDERKFIEDQLRARVAR